MLYSQDGFSSEDRIWRQVNGIWEIVQSDKFNYIIDNKITSYKWGYNELINYNTLITMEPIESYSCITYRLQFVDPLKKELRYMSPFGIKEDRIFYAFRFSGNDQGINKISFIQSTIRDIQKDIAVKWNYEIKENKSVDCSLPLGREYLIEIRISDKRTILLVNKKQMIVVDIAKEEVNSGKFGFSSLHVKPMIWDIKVYNRRKLVFSEDFSTDRVRRIKVRGTIEKK